MKFFNPVLSENINPYDLDNVSKSFGIIDSNNKATIEQRNKVAEALAKMDFNPLDLPYVNSKINDLNKTMDEFSIAGNVGYGLTQVMAKAGDIVGDKVLWDKYRDNQDYKEFKNRILNDKTLGNVEKDYFLSNNIYDPNNIKYDPTDGKAIGTNGWDVTTNPIDKVSFNDIFAAALNYVSEEKGSGESYTFITEDSTPDDIKETTDFSKSNGYVYKKVGSSYQRLPKDKLKKAMYKAIENTPNANESLRQQFDIGNWDADRNNGNTDYTDLYNNVGKRYNFEEWIDAHIDPIAALKSYNYTTTNVDYGNALGKLLDSETKEDKQKRLNSNKNLLSPEEQLIYNDIIGLDITTQPMSFEIDQGDVLEIQYNKAKGNLCDYYEKLTGHVFTPAENRTLSSNIIIDMAKKRLGKDLTQQQINAIESYTDAYNLTFKAKEGVSKSIGLNDSDKQLMDWVSGVNIKKGVPVENRYAQDYMKRFNSIFTENVDKVVINLNDLNDRFFNEAFGGSNEVANNYAKLGIVYNPNGTLTINRSAYNHAYKILAALGQSELDYGYSKRGNSFWLNVTDKLGINDIYDFKYYDKNNNEIEGNDLRTHTNSIMTMNKKINDRYKEINAVMSNQGIGGPRIVEGVISQNKSYSDVFADGLREKYTNLGISPKVIDNLIEKLVKKVDDSIIPLLSQIDFNKQRMSGGIMGENNAGKTLSSDERIEAGKLIRYALQKDKADVKVRPFFSKDAKDGLGIPLQGYVVTIPILDEKGKATGEQRQYYMPDLYDESVAPELINMPHVVATNKAERIKNVENKEWLLTSNTQSHKYLSNCKLKHTNRGFVSNNKILSDEDAINYIMAVNQVESIINSLNNPSINVNGTELKSLLNVVCAYSGGDSDAIFNKLVADFSTK